jgi:hypothetical protein
MTSILSSISGQFGKALILGAFLPATVFMILWSIFIEPIAPTIQTLLQPLGLFSQDWPLIAGAFFIIVITGMLYNLNIPIIRFFEGYPWQFTYLGQRRTAHYKKMFKTAQARQDGMRTLLRAMDPKDSSLATITRYWSASGEALRNTYPNRELLILPTRLGNVIRSFERYSDEQYRMESILFWTRLVAEIDQNYAGVITDAKTSLDFMLNSAVLSAILSFSVLVFGLAFPQNTLSTPTVFAIWAIKIFIFLVLAYLFYIGAISRASAWGETVKGAFDLYRWDLLKQMGYHQTPSTLQAERQLWGNISVQMIYGDHPDRGPLARYTDPPPASLPAIWGEPASVTLSINRGMALTEDDRQLQVLLEAKNLENNQPVSQVILIDQVPDGYEYVWASATCQNRAVSVAGTNPYRFSIGDLAPGETVYMNYLIFRRDLC